MMLNAVYAIDLDLKQYDIKYTDIILTEGDNNAIIFNIHIRDGANEINYSQATARIVFLKEDKTSVQKELSLLPENAGYSYKVGSNEISAIGKVVCSVLLYGENNERLSVSRFIFHVQADMLSHTVVDSSTEMDALSSALQLLKKIEDRLNNIPTVVTLDSYNLIDSAYIPSTTADYIETYHGDAGYGGSSSKIKGWATGQEVDIKVSVTNLEGDILNLWDVNNAYAGAPLRVTPDTPLPAGVLQPGCIYTVYYQTSYWLIVLANIDIATQLAALTARVATLESKT